MSAANYETLDREISARSEDTDDCLAPFASVIKRLNVDGIASYSLAIRKGHMSVSECNALSCTVEENNPMVGSFNIVYCIQFNDGLKWVIKIPSNAHPGSWDTESANALRSEALLMQFLKRETNIPIPSVFAYDMSLDNPTNCPHIIMEFAHGRSLRDMWFDKRLSDEKRKQKRARALMQYASRIIQLNKFTFSKGGSIEFDIDGRMIGIQPLRKVDQDSLLADFEAGGDITTKYITGGPYEDQFSMFIEAFDRRDAHQRNQGDFKKASRKLLRLFLSWIPLDVYDGIETTSIDTHPFVLSHSDPDSQNILVDQDGNITSIIDWDGACSSPRTPGNIGFPSWLTRDWDPLCYDWKSDWGDTPSEEISDEDSPQQLAAHREEYAGYMHAISQAMGATKSTERATKNSMMIDNLLIAAELPMNETEIVSTIFEEIRQHLLTLGLDTPTEEGEVAIDMEDFCFFDIERLLEEDDWSERLINRLKVGFQHFCS
ncbi:hypothetical protein BT63DRAFT_461235 [Microthyrium microscopicum]|uniref:Aminoglycoside phosphotransferase domain-containing protein n=1 Tax=Microthyrium microscopicum TaxID=703497 RepID=A0A6A6TXE4_9PEZI|nr:hypothetical protein BT63DRAFT_461235 [Microthyrium microscopicum]